MSDSVIENASEGTDLVSASITYILAANVENGILSGSTGLDLTGNALDNDLTGNGGDNALVGWDGNDVLTGGDGVDELWGGNGNDALDGGSGNDWLYGAAGADTLTGGSGIDSFYYLDIADSLAGASDFIRDFEDTVDVLDLSGIDADTTTAGDQAFTYVFFEPTGTPGQLWARQENGHTYVWGDVDGDDVADFELVIDGAVALTDVIW